jgi:hypothetical protein
VKRRVLISSREAVPAKSQHKKPCYDCPWARAALNGWLGNNTADEWIQMAHGEAEVECHALTGVYCAGISIYRANNGKVPRNPEQLRLPADRKSVFATRDEFLTHHSSPPPTRRRSTNPTLDHFEQIQETLNEVESNTKGVTRRQYRDFLEEVKGEVDMRLEILDSEDRGRRNG